MVSAIRALWLSRPAALVPFASPKGEWEASCLPSKDHLDYEFSFASDPLFYLFSSLSDDFLDLREASVCSHTLVTYAVALFQFPALLLVSSFFLVLQRVFVMHLPTNL